MIYSFNSLQFSIIKGFLLFLFAVFGCLGINKKKREFISHDSFNQSRKREAGWEVSHAFNDAAHFVEAKVASDGLSASLL
jgi:hypothetical protein